VTAQPQPRPLPVAQVAELLAVMAKALRAFQMYLPNNPVYQRAIKNVQAACSPIWANIEELALKVTETDFIWEEQSVYRQANKSESLSWSLFKDGLRALTIRRGAEEVELPRLLTIINKARFLPADAGDDLPTLLWEHDFEHIEFRFIDFFSGDGAGALPQVSAPADDGQSPADRKARVAQEAAPQQHRTVVELDDSEATLYFLDDTEIRYLARELEEEYQRDVRGSALNVLFDLFELNADLSTRVEILRVLDRLFPNLLNTRDFRSAAMILRECKLLKQKVSQPSAEVAQKLDSFGAKLSDPAIVGQLLQSLDEASALGVDEHAAEVLRELQAAALEPCVSWLPNLTSEPLRKMLENLVDRLAHAYPAEVQRILGLPDSSALPGMIALCGRLGLHQSVPALAEAMAHPDPAMRTAIVQTLGQLATPGALTVIDKAIEDPDRGVRLAAVRAVGARGYKGALRRVENVVLGKTLKEMDLTEKMAFFEAYSAIAGSAAVKPLSSILLDRGLLRMKERPEVRACAAMALGKLKLAEAREVLQRASEDKELVVRNAVSRALREAVK
jgi:hypothetical protein